MEKLQGYGWMIVGVVAALLVPAAGLDGALVSLLSSLAPLPWDRLLLGALILLAFSSLYFRSHWVATLRRLTDVAHSIDREQARARRLADDTERIASIVSDNLEEVADPASSPTHATMYLEGARAHAAKLMEIRDRLVGLAGRLGGAGAAEPPDELSRRDR